MRSVSKIAFGVFATSSLLLACPQKQSSTADAGMIATAPADAGAAGPTCLPCTAAPPATWAFYDQYADPQCKQPVAQALYDACADVVIPDQLNVTFGDPLGRRKPNETAQVQRVSEVASTAPVYRKSGNRCVPADNAGLNLVPAGCSGKKVCRNDAGELVCDGCRNLSTGCPAYAASLARAVFDDKGAPATGGGGSSNLARLKQCCAALAKQAANSPEIGAAVTQCNTMVAALGPNQNAPEVGALKTLLAGKTIPAICSGF